MQSGTSAPTEAAVQVSVYLSFNGDCEAAFQLYERCLGAHLGQIFRYAGTPLVERVPADWSDKVMHGSITIGDQLLMGADVAPDQYEPPKGISLSLHPDSVDEAERIFEGLAEGGRVLAPLEKTFWAERFGMVVDRFGIPWMVNCEAGVPTS
jgi:PhnB protein